MQGKVNTGHLALVIKRPDYRGPLAMGQQTDCTRHYGCPELILSIAIGPYFNKADAVFMISDVFFPTSAC